MLLGLLIFWCVDDHYKIYASMDPGQTIAYISDVGASRMKPLFIAGCCVTTVFLDLSFLSDRWLRHRGRLVPETSTAQKVLSGISIIFAAIGTAGLILLSIFDTLHHPKLHDIFLLLFIAGYILSAIFICWEYQRLGHHYHDHKILRYSFYIKLAFILIELCLAIAFAVTNFLKASNAAAVLEWAVAFIFTFYVLSFYIDLFPAVRTRHMGHGFKSSNPADRQAAEEAMAEAGSDRHLTHPGGHGGVRHSSVEDGVNSNGWTRHADGGYGHAIGNTIYHPDGRREVSTNY